MNTENAAAVVIAEDKKVKAKPAKLSFSKDYSFEVDKLEKALEKLRGDMGRYKSLATKHGLTKTIRDMSGDAVSIVTPEMGAKLKSAGLISAREAEDIRAFSGAIKSLEVILSYDNRKAAELAKRK